MHRCYYAHFHTISWAWILAPLSTSSATTSERPSKPAEIKGVHPSYHRQTGTFKCLSKHAEHDKAEKY